MTMRNTIFSVAILLCAAAFMLSGGIACAHSNKKGIGMGPGKHPMIWRSRLEELHVHWFYTWGSQRPAATPHTIRFVPMMWGYYPRSMPQAIGQIIQAAHLGLVHDLLGFNEPDGKQQSNIKVQTALKAWPALEAAGLPLGSPACVHPDDTWMRTFMRGVRQHGYRVNFICIHWYGGPNPNGFMNMLKHVHNLYHRPLWITEFAVGDWHANKKHPNHDSPQVIAKFMRAVLPAMNRMSYVQRYAWFPADESKFTPLGTSALFNKQGKLTPLGRIYAAD
jgi:hypothetical protein